MRYPDQIPALGSNLIRELDRRAAEGGGLSESVLMENAGRGAADWAEASLATPQGGPIVVLAGPGNNGGDALVMARHLLNRGWSVNVVTVMRSGGAPSPATAQQLATLSSWGVAMAAYSDSPDEEFIHRLSSANFVVDGLLGTGVKGPPRYPFDVWLEALAGISAPLFALDLPSGMDADTGLSMGVALSASATATFGAPKQGFSDASATRRIGRLRVIDVGWPLALFRSEIAKKAP